MDEEKEEILNEDNSLEIIPIVNEDRILVDPSTKESEDRELTLYEQFLEELNSPEERYLFPENKELLAQLPEPVELEAHPWVLEDRELAFSIINELMLSAAEFSKELFAPLTGPVCPYQRTLEEYLGPNYKYPTIGELTLPKNFSFPQTNLQITAEQQAILKNSTEQLDLIAKEAADTGFPGVTSANLGNAFAVLSGNSYIIDKHKLSKHLEFGEMTRNIPHDYIDNHPYLTSFKLLCKYSEII